MIKIVNNKINKLLHSNFEFADFSFTTDEEEKFIHDTYIIKNFSVFDHWITEEEYDTIDVISYTDKSKNTLLYKMYEKKFLNFYLYLYDHNLIYSMFFADRGSKAYVSFENREVYIDYVLLSVREQLFLKIVLPEYYAIIDGGFDLTHMLRVKKNHPEGLEKITKIIKDNGLYILD